MAILTLKHGSFFFIQNVNLTRNKPENVDLDTLTQADLLALKAYIANGLIETDEATAQDVEDRHKKGSSVTAEPKPEAKLDTILEAKVEVIEEKGGEVVETQQLYSDMTNRDLKALIAERNIEVEGTNKAALIEALEAYDVAKAAE